jgi:GTP-binding protein
VIALLDAREGIADQDLHLLGLVLERGRALVIGVNKWDHLAVGRRRRVESEIQRKLQFVSFAPVSFVSALHGSGIDTLLAEALAAHRAAGQSFATSRLTDILSQAVVVHPPPLVAGRRARLRYAHQGGRHPTIIVVHGSRAERVPDHYRRYLANVFRDTLKLRGVPVKLEFKSAENPFAGRRNRLSRRQIKRRQRVIRHGR